MTTQVLERSEAQSSAGFDLRGHHAQCEMNYQLCLSLLPELKAPRSKAPDAKQNRPAKSLLLDGNDALKVTIAIIESAPYTTTIVISQSYAVPMIKPSELKVRLYHDANMAEVVAWDRHRHWLPRYKYPNPLMYQPDEKLVLNRFLGEWLSHCLKVGIVCDLICELGLRNKK